MLELMLILLFATTTAFCGLYIKYLIGRIKEVSNDFLEVKTIVESYESSLKIVYESETFYGEPVLQALVEQTREVSDDLDAIIENYEYDEGLEIEEA